MLDSEMTGARLSALETLARNRHDGSTPLPNETSQLVAHLVVRVSALEAIERPEPTSAQILSAVRRARYLVSSILRAIVYAARSTVGTFCAGVMFAVLCALWMDHYGSRPTPSGIGNLNMMRYGSVNMPTLRQHGTILKTAADYKGSSLFDGGATVIVHEDDTGAIAGSWQPDVASQPSALCSKISSRHPTLAVRTSDAAS